MRQMRRRARADGETAATGPTGRFADGAAVLVTERAAPYDCTDLLGRLRFTTSTLKSSFDERCLCPCVAVSVGAVLGGQTPFELAVIRCDVGSTAQEVPVKKLSSPEYRRALDRMEMIGARSLSGLGK